MCDEEPPTLAMRVLILVLDFHSPRVLFVRRPCGTLELPGGGVAPGGSLAEAAVDLLQRDTEIPAKLEGGLVMDQTRTGSVTTYTFVVSAGYLDLQRYPFPLPDRCEWREALPLYHTPGIVHSAIQQAGEGKVFPISWGEADTYDDFVSQSTS